MKRFCVFLIFFLFKCVINTNAVNNCEFRHDFKPSRFEYHCKETLNENCDLPDDIDTVTHLKITDCPLETVKNAYKNFKNLQSLDLSYNSLDLLELNHTHLKELNVSHSNLTEIPNEFFKNVPEITEIDLSFNSIKEIKECDFEDGINLVKIHLNHNRLRSFRWPSFMCLKNLQYIDLSWNDISHVDGTFYQYTTFSEVHLENNPIETFYFNIKAERNGSIYITWKLLQNFNTKESDGEIDVILNSSIEGVFIKPGKIEMHFLEGEILNDFVKFEAEDNKVKNITKWLSLFGSHLWLLHLKNNNFGKFEINSLERFKKLRVLDLENTKLKEFDFALLKNQPDLLWFSISDNNLKAVQNISVIKTLKEIGYFKIANNQLRNTLDIIECLSETLQELDVCGNYVGQLNRKTFEKFHKLEFLRLNNVQLITFNFNPFEDQKLKYLGLSDNNLENQNFRILSKTLEELMYFEAANCSLKKPKEVLKLFGTSIQQIKLSGNFIGELDMRVFETFFSLKKLNLTSTNLTMFDTNVVNYMAYEPIIDISNNNLKMIHFSTAIPVLGSLYLHGNDLTEFQNVQQLNSIFVNHTLTIGNNQFSCDYLKELKRKWGDLITDEAINQKYGRCEIEIEESIKSTSEEI